MGIDAEIEKVFREWGEMTADDLREEANAALKAAGRKNPQTIGLQFDERIVTIGGDVGIEIRAVKQGTPAKYWRAIEEGRRPGLRMPPSSVFGKRWQNEQQIDARQVLIKMQGLKRPKKALNYDKAVRQLSFIIARSIGRKGIKPKPYLDRVLTTSRIQLLRAMLTPVIGKKFKLIIKGLE